MRRALLVVAAALAFAAPAAATLPVYPTGSSLGEGLPLKAYASVTPTVHLFGDAVTARLAVVADTKYVDPQRLRIATDFLPYTALHESQLRIRAGRFEQVTWTWTLHCLTADCVPESPPSEKFHVFHFRPVQIEYLALNGTPAYGITAAWPAVEVVSHVSPGVVAALLRTKQLNWRYQLAPVAAPTYRFPPTLVSWVALALAGLALAAAAVLARRWYFVLRPERAPPPPVAPRTTIERALAVLRWAHERGDETLQRKALERVADELAAAEELTRMARELAWSPRTPEDAEVEDFAEQVRGAADEEGGR